MLHGAAKHVLVIPIKRLEATIDYGCVIGKGFVDDPVFGLNTYRFSFVADAKALGIIQRGTLVFIDAVENANHTITGVAGLVCVTFCRSILTALFMKSKLMPVKNGCTDLGGRGYARTQAPGGQI